MANSRRGPLAASVARVLEIPGGKALSAFRLERLAEAVRDEVPAVAGLHAEFVQFAALSAPELSAREMELLRAVLEPRHARGPKPGAARRGSLLVVPRPGTISPWSSKATNIVRNCGLDRVVRLERAVIWWLWDADERPLRLETLGPASCLLHDRMTQAVLSPEQELEVLFRQSPPVALEQIPLSARGAAALEDANRDLGLALSREEIDYLLGAFRELKRDPTDLELMMFAQANSEHCRHKIFNARWSLDGEPQTRSLFEMIRNTHARAPDGVLSAYRDNAAVIAGRGRFRFGQGLASGVYGYEQDRIHILMKVETHNHPTAISPYPGAATGVGGEIRDEGACGRGGTPKAGITGFSVSNLRIPGFLQPWEVDHGRPTRIASALDIMLEAPIGGAGFGNEFGRPNLVGYFRTYEQRVAGPGGPELRGYHKPIMLAGGVGNVREPQIEKRPLAPGARIVVLGGPAMLIGLGGGAASSLQSGSSSQELDYASVQRDNPEMQRRCQEVIERCLALGADNPVLSIHDVGAGGLSNAVPEIVHGAGRGAEVELRDVPCDEPGMSPLQIWCNESQERYVLAVDAERMDLFRRICERERAEYAEVGQVAEHPRLLIEDRHFANRAADLPLSVLFGDPPQMVRKAGRATVDPAPFAAAHVDLDEAVERVLRLPAVADKSFLITIGDRSVGGLVCRDQMVGPWQVPVADVAVTAASYRETTGEAVALGERAPLALIDAPASGRMAVGEAITNIAAARIDRLGEVKLSANWMAAAGHEGEDVRLYETVAAVAMELCPALGIAVPVGKDSLSMKTTWDQGGEPLSMAAPLSLIVSAFAPVVNVERTLTPMLRTDVGETVILALDLGQGRHRLGGSALAQVYGELGADGPDLGAPELLRGFFALVQRLNEDDILLAYHDRSDGGFLVALCEMAFASRIGLSVELEGLGADPIAALFSEELGALLQVRTCDRERVLQAAREEGVANWLTPLARPEDGDEIVIEHGGRTLFRAPRAHLHKVWSETGFRLQRLRDDPDCAREEFERLDEPDDPGLAPHLSFDPAVDPGASMVRTGARPRVAILREQGVNGHVEMAAAFHRAGFEPVDVHMTDLAAGRRTLADCLGAVASGGFTYGDVLGAGGGWAMSILHDPRTREAFAEFLTRPDSFALGVCNGCQMFSHLRELIPGAGLWPDFVRNRSEQFEARLGLVEVSPGPSLFLHGMEGSRLPVVIAHGEGRAVFEEAAGAERLADAGLIALRYVDNRGHAGERYPYNPNGSPGGMTGFTTPDGRVTIMMPHPERVVLRRQHSWHPADWGEEGPWLRMFRNARAWVG